MNEDIISIAATWANKEFGVGSGFEIIIDINTRYEANIVSHLNA